MLIFNILFSSVIVYTACAHIQYHELNIKIFDTRSESLAEDLSRNLDEAKDFLTSGTAKSIVKTTVHVPGVSDVAKIVSLALISIDERTWKDMLIQSIEEQHNRGIIESNIQQMIACIANIQREIHILELNHNYPVNEKREKIMIIEREIRKMINFFAASDSIFRKHAEFAYLPLSVLTPIVAVFEPLIEESVPELGRQPFTACKFVAILQEYRFLAAVNRLKAIKLKYYERLQYRGINTSPLVSNVMSRSYNPNCYHNEWDSSNGLEVGSCQSASELQVCLKDMVGDREYHVETSSLHEAYSYPGAVRYMEEVRLRVELAFNKLIRLANEECPREEHSQRMPTGMCVRL